MEQHETLTYNISFIHMLFATSVVMCPARPLSSESILADAVAATTAVTSSATTLPAASVLDASIVEPSSIRLVDELRP